MPENCFQLPTECRLLYTVTLKIELNFIEFSSVDKLTTLDSKNRDVRIFTEDGIYEVTMLAKTEKAVVRDIEELLPKIGEMSAKVWLNRMWYGFFKNSDFLTVDKNVLRADGA